MRDKRIEGISDIRDESDARHPSWSSSSAMRCPMSCLNQLYRFTPLQSNFGANTVALDAVGGR